MSFYNCSRWSSWRHVLSMTAMAWLLVGCTDNADKRYPVTGTVMLDGKRLDNAAILFAPQGAGVTAIATITNGQFELAADDGLSPGMYDVRINPSEPELTEIQTDPQRHPHANKRSKIPTIYQRTGQLSARISNAPVHSLHFELKSSHK